MESLIMLVTIVLLAIPASALIALVRTRTLRKLIGEQYEEHQRTVSELRREIADLRRSLARVSEKVDQSATPAAMGHAAAPEQISHPVVPVEEKSAAGPAPVFEPSKQVVTVPPEPVAPSTPPRPAAPSLEPAITAACNDAKPAVTASQPATTPNPEFPPVPVPPRPGAPPLAIPPREPERSRATAHTAGPTFSVLKDAPPRKSLRERLRSAIAFEEMLGANWLNKIGIVILVLGIALFGIYKLGELGPGGKVALLYAVAVALLGGGIYVERRPNYQVIGRAGIGGAWALLFFITYAMHHVQAMLVMPSETLNCVLLLGVAAGMAVHTLRYRSQLVTGLSFLLALSTVALSQDTVYALTAGAILALGIVAISLREGWYELEVFGILASYLNHLYWLWRLHPNGMAGHTFPEFWPSTIILLLYWLTFRISYVTRRIRSPRDEQVSTVAALVNTTLLLAVMKFQSTRPELAFYALLALGALEFFFGQLPPTRRRRSAFINLTTVGTLLIFAAVPFKFTGNNIALLWMLAAEALLIAGIVQAEVVFRRLGLLTGLFTGLLIAYQARYIIEFRRGSESVLLHDGILLLTCSALFYANALFISRRWQKLFGNLDSQLATAHSYIGCATAFIGCWGIFVQDWTAVAWAAVMLATAIGARRLVDKHLLFQASIVAVAAFARGVLINCHFETVYPHHIGARLITLPILAVIFYCTGAVASRVAASLRPLALTMGTALIALLIWTDVSPNWVALSWVAAAVALALIGRGLTLDTLCYHEHLLAIIATVYLFTVNLDAQATTARDLSFVLSAALLYAISRRCTTATALYARPAAWIHTWAGTALLAALAWHESPPVWLAVLWAAFAFALTVFDRLYEVEELPYQAHALAALAVLRAVTLNIYTAERWHNFSLRLITLSIVVVILYLLARWVRMPEDLRKRDIHHVYSWTGSFLAAWMLWSELQPVSVALGIAVFGLVLFQWGILQKQTQLRLQAYVALTVAFVRIFFVNLTAVPLEGELIGPRLYTVVPIVLIYFLVWAQLQAETSKTELDRWSVADIIAYFGTSCITALLYFQISPEWIVVSWAALVLVLMTASLLLKRAIFLHQAMLVTVAVVARSMAHNLFGESYFTAGAWRGRFEILSITAALLFAALPIAFRLRDRYGNGEKQAGIKRCVLFAAAHPEQLLFFAPVLLVTLMIFVKMDPGMVTLSWGIEGVLLFLLALAAKQRSYRLTGLSLLLLCVGKIMLKDAWRLSESDRYITFIVLGAALVLVSFLYSKYRDSLRQYL